MDVKMIARNAVVRQDCIVRPDTKFVRPIFPQECVVLRVSRISKMATAEIAEPRNPQRRSFSSMAFPSASVSTPFLISEMISSFRT